MNVAKNFISRVHRLSTNLSIEQKAEVIDSQLKLNHYPSHLRHRLINRMTENPQPLPNTIAAEDQQQQTALPPDPPPQPPPSSQQPPQSPSPPQQRSSQQHTDHIYRSIVQIPHLSQRIARQLKKEYPNTRLAYRNINTTNKIFSKVKDPLPPGHQTNVIYQIPCKDCQACYIGMTKNRLDTRMYGHKTHYNTLDRLQQNITDPSDPKIEELAEKTALMQHSIKNNHRFDLGNVNIIDRHDKEHALPILEMCHIKNNQHCINKRTDTDGLNVVYAGILHAIKTTQTQANTHITNTN